MRNQFGIPVATNGRAREIVKGFGLGLIAFGPVLIVVLLGGLR